MIKGQMFSMDFLAAAVIILLGFGLLTGLAEMNSYNQKQKQGFDVMEQKAETAAIAMANSPQFDCNIGTTELAYSLDLNKIGSYNADGIKTALGLTDYNAQITIDSIPAASLPSETISGDSIASLDTTVAVCNGASFSDLNNCARSAPACNDANFSMHTLTVRVAR